MWSVVLDIVFGVIWLVFAAVSKAHAAWALLAAVYVFFTINDLRKWRQARRRTRTIEQFYLQPGAREFVQGWFQYIYVREYPQVLDWEQVGWRAFLRKCGLRRPAARWADTLAAWAANRTVECAIVESFAKFLAADLERLAEQNGFPLEYARLSTDARCTVA